MANKEPLWKRSGFLHPLKKKMLTIIDAIQDAMAWTKNNEKKDNK